MFTDTLQGDEIVRWKSVKEDSALNFEFLQNPGIGIEPIQMVSHNVDQPKGQFDPEKRPEFSKVFPVSASSEIDSDQGLGSSVGAEKVNDGDSVLDVNPFDVGQPSEAEKKLIWKVKKWNKGS